jgi:hypothetical protein
MRADGLSAELALANDSVKPPIDGQFSKKLTETTRQ